MQYSTALVFATLTALAQAVKFDFIGAFTPVAGEPIVLTWSEAAGPVTITLVNGDIGDLQDVEVVATGQTSGTFTWTPPTDLVSDRYALEIDDGGELNYSTQFDLSGTGVVSTTSEEASTTTSDPVSTVTESTSATDENTTTADSTTVATTSRSSTETSTSETAEATPPPNLTGGSERLAPVALFLTAIAAFAMFN